MAKPLELTLSDLQVFVETGRHRSLRESARSLGLKPAHLSKIIRRLEDRLGARLFSRSASGIQATPEALELLRKAEAVMSAAEGLGSRSRPAGREQRVFGVGSVSFLISSLVAPLCGPLTRAHPDTRFRLVETPREELIAQGLEGVFDIAFHAGALDWPRSWATRKIGDLRFRLYARAGHPLPTRTTEARVLRHAFVVPTYWVGRKLVPGMDQCPVPLSQRIWGQETTTAVSALELVRSSDQLAFLPRVIAAQALKRGEVREISVEGWDEVSREVFVSVRAAGVPQSLLRSITKLAGLSAAW